MAIVQTGTVLEITESVGNNTGTASSTITVPADAELVVVSLHSYTGTVNFYSGGGLTFTKGGVDTAMTMVQPSTRGDSDVNAWMVAMAYLALPDTGSNKTLKWDWLGTGSSASAVKYAITFWKGLDTASPVRGSGGGQNASGLPYTTNTITALSGDLIVAFAGGFTGGSEAVASTFSNLTQLATIVTTSAADGVLATGSPSGNTTVALSTGTNWQDGGIIAISLKPAAAAASGGAQVLRGLFTPLSGPTRGLRRTEAFPVVAAATTDGVLSSAGIGTATFVGASIFAGVLAAAGVGTASLVGSSTAAATLASAGVGSANLVGAATAASVLASSGTSVATFTGAATGAGVLAASGTATVSFTGSSTAASVLASAGLGSMAGIGASTAEAVLNASGAGTFTGTVTPTTDAVFSSSGSGSFAGTGAATAASVLSAAGVGNMTAAAPSDATELHFLPFFATVGQLKSF